MAGRRQRLRVFLSSTDKLNPAKALTVERGFDLPIAIGTNPSKLDILMPHPWEPEAAKAIIDHGEYDAGDRVCAVTFAEGDPNVGKVNGTPAQGTDRVAVTGFIRKMIRPGHVVEFTSHDTMYLVKDIDEATNELILDEPLDQALANDEDIKLRVAMLWKVRPSNTEMEKFGEIAPGATHLPKNTTLRIVYKHANNPTAVASAHFRLIYKY